FGWRKVLRRRDFEFRRQSGGGDEHFRSRFAFGSNSGARNWNEFERRVPGHFNFVGLLIIRDSTSGCGKLRHNGSSSIRWNSHPAETISSMAGV
ncbi:MAG: hypothetical protein ACRD41_02785, partial [Candidatus Acidiferrales bacterium]